MATETPPVEAPSKFTPQHAAVTALALGVGLAVAGVYLLAGLGWALLAAAAPLLLLAAVLLRGLLLHAQ